MDGIATQTQSEAFKNMYFCDKKKQKRIFQVYIDKENTQKQFLREIIKYSRKSGKTIIGTTTRDLFENKHHHRIVVRLRKLIEISRRFVKLTFW